MREYSADHHYLLKMGPTITLQVQVLTQTQLLAQSEIGRQGATTQSGMSKTHTVKHNRCYQSTDDACTPKKKSANLKSNPLFYTSTPQKDIPPVHPPTPPMTHDPLLPQPQPPSFHLHLAHKTTPTKACIPFRSLARKLTLRYAALAADCRVTFLCSSLIRTTRSRPRLGWGEFGDCYFLPLAFSLSRSTAFLSSSKADVRHHCAVALRDINAVRR